MALRLIWKNSENSISLRERETQAHPKNYVPQHLHFSSEIFPFFHFYLFIFSLRLLSASPVITFFRSNICFNFSDSLYTFVSATIDNIQRFSLSSYHLHSFLVPKIIYWDILSTTIIIRVRIST